MLVGQWQPLPLIWQGQTGRAARLQVGRTSPSSITCTQHALLLKAEAVVQVHMRSTAASSAIRTARCATAASSSWHTGLDAQAREQAELFIDLLLKANERMNLTGAAENPAMQLCQHWAHSHHCFLRPTARAAHKPYTERIPAPPESKHAH